MFVLVCIMSTCVDSHVMEMGERLIKLFQKCLFFASNNLCEKENQDVIGSFLDMSYVLLAACTCCFIFSQFPLSLQNFMKPDTSLLSFIFSSPFLPNHHYSAAASHLSITYITSQQFALNHKVYIN